MSGDLVRKLGERKMLVGPIVNASEAEAGSGCSRLLRNRRFQAETDNLLETLRIKAKAPASHRNGDGIHSLRLSICAEMLIEQSQSALGEAPSTGLFSKSIRGASKETKPF